MQSHADPLALTSVLRIVAARMTRGKLGLRVGSAKGNLATFCNPGEVLFCVLGVGSTRYRCPPPPPPPPPPFSLSDRRKRVSSYVCISWTLAQKHHPTLTRDSKASQLSPLPTLLCLFFKTPNHVRPTDHTSSPDSDASSYLRGQECNCSPIFSHMARTVLFYSR